MIILTNVRKEANGTAKPNEIPIQTPKLTVLPKPEPRIEKPQPDVPQDQVGNCDNLTASYWG